MMMSKAILVQFFLSFLAVTLDEFVVLILFFSRSFQNDESLLTIQVFVGHIVGFTLVVALSLAIGCAGLVIPLRYLSYLGLIPIYLGLHDLVKRIPRYCKRFQSKPQHQQQTAAFRDDSSDDEENNPQQWPNRGIELAPPVQGVIENLPLLQSQLHQPAATYASITAKATDNLRIEHSSPSVSSITVNSAEATKHSCSPHMWSRLAITDPDMMYVIGAALAEASEEIAVFAPLFALLVQLPTTRASAASSVSHTEAATPTLKNGHLSWQSLSTLLAMICWLYVLLLAELCLAYAIALYLSAPAMETQRSTVSPWTWVWERIVKLGMPVVLIAVGVTVLMGLWQDDL